MCDRESNQAGGTYRGPQPAATQGIYKGPDVTAPSIASALRRRGHDLAAQKAAIDQKLQIIHDLLSVLEG